MSRPAVVQPSAQANPGENIFDTFVAFHAPGLVMFANEMRGRGDMRSGVLRLAATAVLVAAATLASGRIEAMPFAAPRALHAGGLALAQPAQFFHLGKPYCWYRYGWSGAGWYWCGYGTRVGVGWGGTYGWNGWVVPRSQRAAGVRPGYRYGRYR